MKAWLVVVAVLVAFGSIARATVWALPLSDPHDPVRLSDAEFNVDDPARPALTVHIENATTGPLTTGQIWLNYSRFFTRAEMIRNGNRIAFSCGKMAHADIDEPVKAVPPGERVQVKMFVNPACTLDLRHEHFFVTVERISGVGGRYGPSVWKREPADFSQLLHAAMPHE